MKKLLSINTIFAFLLLLVSSCDSAGPWADYEPPQIYKPVIYSVAPAESVQGSTVTITGFNFKDVISVMIGSTEATEYTLDSIASKITVTVPVNAAVGAQPIALTNGDGTTVASFTVLKKPVPVDVTLKVMSFGISNSKANLEEVEALIRKYNPDLVALREIDSYNTRTDPAIDQGKVIADKLGMNYLFASGWPYRGGEYGPSLLSRFPIKEKFGPTLLPGATTRPLGYATVEVVEGFDLMFVAVQMEDGSATNRNRDQPLQAQRLLEILGTTQLPVIMGGNFYFDSQTAPHMQTLYSQFTPGCLGCTLTFPANAPAFVVDHIMFREGLGVKMEVVSYTVGSEEDVLNNKKPVISEIRITRK
ncbi:endonuclease/exonuclease/phosphatase family protein [Rufibacter psychrotolerans]|uniref:endonuclease/exonuclease/phosphatase family protein n=1 Tax=Rufibacter psychrotolerans TaxID=2812556 RepID=UPI00196804EC|nr:endonuclease/exonuclease/phosphatase family protein [Rufibacter sp. SYSU D00308]